jgi:hypothetical protein
MGAKDQEVITKARMILRTALETVAEELGYDDLEVIGYLSVFECLNKADNQRTIHVLFGEGDDTSLHGCIAHAYMEAADAAIEGGGD